MKTNLWFLFAFLCFLVGVSNAQNANVNNANRLSPKINISSKKVQVAEIGCPNDLTISADVYIRIDNVPDNVESKDYKYTVSAGQIKGEGRSVFWNLDGAKPGVYTITLQINQNGKIISASETVQVVEPLCCIKPCECARVLINASSMEIKTGETVRFQVLIEDGTQEKDEITFNWEIVGGKILDGQGKNEIVVEADSNDETELTAKVEVNGLCSVDCPNNASSTVKIKQK